jgi:hypothetical protein
MTSPTTTRNGARKPSSRLRFEDKLDLVVHSLTRELMAQRAGAQYAGDRDVYHVAGYPKTLSFKDYSAMYDRDPVAGVVVDMPAETTWRVTPELTETAPSAEEPAPTDTKFLTQWDELSKRLRVYQRFERVDKQARIGRYAVLFIGARDAKDDTALSTPLARLSKPQDVQYLSSFDESAATVTEWVTDPNDARFGLPLFYNIKFSQEDTNAFRGFAGKVHWSRVIHVAEDLLDDEVYGRPALQRVYNPLMDLLKVSASSGEAFWQQVAGVLQAVVDNSKDSKGLSDEDMKKLDTALNEIYHNLRRKFIGQGVKLERLAGEQPDPGPAAQLIMRLIAAGTRIPMRLLFGSETGERASSEDQKSFLGMIQERRKQYAEQTILRPFIDRLLMVGALARPTQAGEYTVVWPPLFTESELDRANVSLARANTAKALTPVGGDPIELVEVDEERDVRMKLWKDGKPPREVIEPPAVVAPGAGPGVEPEPGTEEE